MQSFPTLRAALASFPGGASARIDRVITHWTAGTYAPNAVDLAHYHFIIKLNPKDPSKSLVVAANHPAKTLAHTRGLNTYSLGISAACMFKAKQGGPYGYYPLNARLWEDLAAAAAEACTAYAIPITEKNLLQHAEVTKTYGILQRGRWDCTELPWEDSDPEEVCAQFRRKAQWYQDNPRT